MFIPHASASTAGLLGIIPRPSILSRLFLAGYGPTATVQLCVDTLLDPNSNDPNLQKTSPPLATLAVRESYALPELGIVSLLVDWFRKRPTQQQIQIAVTTTPQQHEHCWIRSSWINLNSYI